MKGTHRRRFTIRCHRIRLQVSLLGRAVVQPSIVLSIGDNRITADSVARKLGIENVHADVLPTEKNAVVKRLQSEHRIVAVAGDGVNDAPALAQAHVGIAMGTATDVAMESAGVTLIKGDLRGIVRTRQLS